MADDEVKKILFSLELEHLMESFAENKITIHVIKKLNENLISSLIPIIGDRAIFMDYWCKHFKNKYCNNLEFPEKEINCQKVNNENSSAILNVVPQYKNNSSMISLEQLKGLLHNSETGRRIITSYKQTTVFNDKQRSKLCDIIVTSMEDRSIR
ncbi:uncharacterized protein LOC143372267 [Andrena cerasifolii]|uniref:uncharacterized protein LOC143372267 n=1 Tax=Andrena cerasifolii TaxID=2819439 RepID=UPI004037EADA